MIRSIACGLVVVLAGACTALPRHDELPAVHFRECDARGVDADEDGLADTCELALAGAFAPMLAASPSACNVVSAAGGERLGGGYFFAVQPRGDGARIAYLTAYFRDCGWHGPKCRLPGVSCAPHAGDSEFIALDVVRDAASWRVHAVFLSAHCFGRSNESCRWYAGRELGEFEWHGGPVVWVARGRNANYPSREACERGHTLLDTCDAAPLRYRYPIAAERNIGSRRRPFQYRGVPPGCAASEHVDPSGGATVDGAVECFWQPGARFRGWQATGAGVTPYEHYLATAGGM